LSKKWTWRQSPGSSHGGEQQEKTIYAPGWIWERSTSIYALFRTLGVDHEIVQDIIRQCNNGRTTAAGSKITSKMIMQNLTPYRELFPYRESSGTLDYRYYDGHLIVQNTEPVYDFDRHEIIFPDCTYGDLYVAGYWWIGDVHDDDPDTDFTYHDILWDLGDKALIDGEMRYIGPYYSFKHITELNRLSAKMRGSDREVAYTTEHNLNTYYAMSKRGKGTRINVVGGDGSSIKRSNRLVDGLELWSRPDTREMQIFPLEDATMPFMVSTWGDYNYELGILIQYSHAEEELGLYDQFDKYPSVYIINDTWDNPAPIFDLGNDKTLNFSGVMVLGGPTHE